MTVESVLPLSDFSSFCDQMKSVAQANQSGVEVTLKFDNQKGDRSSKIAPPDASQLKEINRLTGQEWEADDWLCAECHMSDCLVDKTDQAWHPDVLRQMQATCDGNPLVTDHRWSADNSKGFLIHPKLYIDEKPRKQTLNLIGKGDYNKKIVKRDGGMICLSATICVRSDSEAAQMIRDRNWQNLSTGGKIKSVQYICPNCTEQKGREVGFYEKDKNDDYVCPHVMRSPWIEYAMANGYIDADLPVADYTLVNGEYYSVELSFVLSGALPAASIQR